MNIDFNNLDHILFEYFEGNLSHEDMQSVEEYIALNPECKEDFEGWSKTLIQAPLVQNPALTKQLLKVSKPKFFPYTFFGMIVLMIASLVYFTNKDHVHALSSYKKDKRKYPEKKLIAHVRSEGSVTVTNVADMKDQPVDFQLKDHAAKQAVKKTVFVKTETFVSSGNTPDSLSKTLQEISVTKTDSSTILNSSNDQDALKNADTLSKKATADVKPKALTRKELRKIERFKRQAIAKKLQQEYMKGNKPYVVPTSPDF